MRLLESDLPIQSSGANSVDSATVIVIYSLLYPNLNTSPPIKKKMGFANSKSINTYLCCSTNNRNGLVILFISKLLISTFPKALTSHNKPGHKSFIQLTARLKK